MNSSPPESRAWREERSGMREMNAKQRGLPSGTRTPALPQTGGETEAEQHEEQGRCPSLSFSRHLLTRTVASPAGARGLPSH